MKLLPILSFFLATLAWFPPSVHAAPGDLDTTFGTGGKVTIPAGIPGGSANDSVVQSDGKIVLTGAVFNSTTGQDFVVGRLVSRPEDENETAN